MRRDVNKFLLALLLIACVGIVLLVVYYNLSYHRLNTRYDDALDKLENKTAALNKTLIEVQEKEAKLQEKEQALQTYLEELNLSKKRESQLGSRFQDVKQTKENLAQSLNETIKERNRWINTYEETNQDLKVCETDLQGEKNTISSMQSRANNLILKVDSLKPRTGTVDAAASDIYSSLQDLNGERSTLNQTHLLMEKDTFEEHIEDMKDKATSIQSEADKLSKGFDDISEGLDRIKNE